MTNSGAMLKLLISLSLVSIGQSLDLTTASIKSVTTAIQTGEVTCRQIIQGYIDRINRYNPMINAIIAINPKALQVKKSIFCFNDRATRPRIELGLIKT